MSGPVNVVTEMLLPDHATAFEASQSGVDQRLLAEDADLIRTQREPASCSASFLPFLAWERSVHHWTGTDAATDRARTASSFADHAGYGSPAALEEEIALDVGTPIVVREWFEVPGFAWPDFEVVVPIVIGAVMPTDAEVIASAIRRKNVRDWPHILFEGAQATTLGFGAVGTVAAVINILPLDATPAVQGPAYWGAAGSFVATINVLPY